MADDTANSPRRSLLQLWRSLRSTIRAANHIVPGASLVAMILAASMIAVFARVGPLMLFGGAMIVLTAALMIFVKTSNYGESMLALVAGLLTVLTVEWTPGLFVIFGTAWVGFTLLAFLISSVKLAAKVEDIYVQAALAISEDSDPGKKVEKELRAAAEAAGVDFLDPVEKAEIIRLLAFRKVPIAGMTAALKMVERLHVLTKVPSMTYADFVADIYWSILRSSSSDAVLTLDGIYGGMKSSAVPPQDFIEGYRATRHLVLSGEIGITTQFDLIRDLLEQGYPVHRLEEGIRARLP